MGLPMEFEVMLINIFCLIIDVFHYKFGYFAISFVQLVRFRLKEIEKKENLVKYTFRPSNILFTLRNTFGNEIMIFRSKLVFN